MLIGVDTGFFIELKNENQKAKEIWNKIVKSEDELAISVLSINEILVYFFRNGKSKQGKELLTLLKIFPNIKLIPVSERIAELSAGYRYGLGIPTIDSLILTTFIYERCDKVISTDKHFLKAKKQNIIEVEDISKKL
ncbi:MAG: hypothetical protein B6D64_10340 [Bacteroidetes bacterium 4484_276]|nr:MAG: hypothetical protein B6D64_10340 [Bacteroidetes bacterium 4484_276]